MNRERFTRLARTVVHPVVFAVYPVAFLLSQNIGDMHARESVRAVAFALAFGLVVFGAVRLVVRDRHKAGAIASLLIVVTFLYAEYSASIWQILAVWLAVGMAAVAIALSRRNWRQATLYLNVVGLLLVLSSLVTIVPYEIQRAGSDTNALATDRPLTYNQPEHDANGQRPNIYYVILDGYGRDDILARFYNHDNRYFTDALREQGFYVADRARSNYARTALSVVSTLYATYLSDYIEQNGLEESRDVQRIFDLLPNSSVFRFLKERGYTTYAYSSTVLNYPADEQVVPEAFLSYFEREVAARTPFSFIFYKLFQRSSYRMHFENIMSTISRMDESVELPSPKFVFTHIVCPHPPMVFDRNGNFREDTGGDHRLTDGNAMVGNYMTAEDYQQQYSEQVHWLNGVIMEWVKKVRETDPNAVIVLQGDHGPGSMLHWNSLQQTNMLERFSILNAICLPGAGDDVLYSDITSVNTFRVIFNQYFGSEFELLPDSSFFSEAHLPLWLYEIHFSKPAANEQE